MFSGAEDDSACAAGSSLLPTPPREDRSKAGYRRRLGKASKAVSSQSECDAVPFCKDDDLGMEIVANDMDLLSAGTLDQMLILESTGLLTERPPDDIPDCISFTSGSSPEHGRRVDSRLRFPATPTHFKPLSLCGAKAKDDDLRVEIIANEMDLPSEDPCDRMHVPQSTGSIPKSITGTDSSFDYGSCVDSRLMFSPGRNFKRLLLCDGEAKELCSGETAGTGSECVVGGSISLLRNLTSNGRLLDSTEFASEESVFEDPLLMGLAEQVRASVVKDCWGKDAASSLPSEKGFSRDPF